MELDRERPAAVVAGEDLPIVKAEKSRPLLNAPPPPMNSSMNVPDEHSGSFAVKVPNGSFLRERNGRDRRLLRVCGRAAASISTARATRTSGGRRMRNLLLIPIWNVSWEADVTPVEEFSGGDLILEVDPAGGTRKATGAAAVNDRVLAASVDLRAGRYIRIPLGGELIGRGKGARGPAIEASDEDLLAALLVDAAQRPIVLCGQDLGVPATFRLPVITRGGRSVKSS